MRANMKLEAVQVKPLLRVKVNENARRAKTRKINRRGDKGAPRVSRAASRARAKIRILTRRLADR